MEEREGKDGREMRTNKETLRHGFTIVQIPGEKSPTSLSRVAAGKEATQD